MFRTDSILIADNSSSERAEGGRSSNATKRNRLDGGAIAVLTLNPIICASFYISVHPNETIIGKRATLFRFVPLRHMVANGIGTTDRFMEYGIKFSVLLHVFCFRRFLCGLEVSLIFFHDFDPYLALLL